MKFLPFLLFITACELMTETGEFSDEDWAKFLEERKQRKAEEARVEKERLVTIKIQER